MIPEKRGGGGLAMGVLNDLKPVAISEGEDEEEYFSVEVTVTNSNIRCCVAFDDIENKKRVWNCVETDVSEASQRGTGFIFPFDGSLWAGDLIVPNDPRPQNKNGRLFQEFLKRNPH